MDSYRLISNHVPPLPSGAQKTLAEVFLGSDGGHLESCVYRPAIAFFGDILLLCLEHVS